MYCHLLIEAVNEQGFFMTGKTTLGDMAHNILTFRPEVRRRWQEEFWNNGDTNQRTNAWSSRQEFESLSWDEPLVTLQVSNSRVDSSGPSSFETAGRQKEHTLYRGTPYPQYTISTLIVLVAVTKWQGLPDPRLDQEGFFEHWKQLRNTQLASLPQLHQKQR